MRFCWNQFAESLALVAAMNPDTTDSESLRASLTTIDSVSTEDPDGFWPAVLESVAIGDYETT